MPAVVHVRRAIALGGAVVFSLAGGVFASSAASANEGGGRYVSLGDSYVSGPLIPVQSGGLCLRSSQNYPSLAAAALGYALDDASCSGSTTNEMDNPQTDLGITINAPELDSVTSDTNLVTLGIGGNDIGFINIIETCAEESLTSPAGDPCTQHYNAGGTDQLAAAVEATGPRSAPCSSRFTRMPRTRRCMLSDIRISCPRPVTAAGRWSRLLPGTSPTSGRPRRSSTRCSRTRPR